MPIVQIFLAVFIFILIVLISIEDISTGFLLLLLLVPLQHKELFSLVIWDVLPVRIAFFGILLTTFYRFYLWFRRYKEKKIILSFIKDPVLILLSLLFVVRLLSIIFVAENKIAGLKLLAFYTTIVYLYLLIKFLYVKYGNSVLLKATTVFTLIGTVTGLVAAIQYFVFIFYKIKFGAIWDIAGQNPRVGSTFWDVNHFGAFIASIIPVSASFIFFKKGYSRLFWALNTIFLCAVIYITQSRSAWLGLLFGSLIFILFLLSKGYKRYAKLLSIFSILSLLLLLSYFQFFGGGVVAKYKSFMHSRLDSFDTHFILVEGAMEVYRDNPWLGRGYGNFNEAFRKTSFAQEYFFREKNIVNERVPSHSVWGEVASETGFFGISFYVLLFFIILAFSLYGFLKSKEKSSFIVLGTACGVISLLISGIFYTYNLEFYWILAFLSVTLGYSYNKDFSFAKLLVWVSKVKHLPTFFILGFSSFFLFWDLGKNTLLDWDEAIYASVSKNIISTGNFLTLQWPVDTNWFEKPPLYFWISSFFMRIFGVNEFSARLPSAIFALLGILLVYKFSSYLFKSKITGFLSALMLATTAHYIYYARMGMLDVMVTFFITLSLYFGYKFYTENNTKYSLYSGLACGFGVLVKSVVGILPLAILGIFGVTLLLLNKVSLKKLSTGISLFLISFLLVAMPWHFYMYQLYGSEFLNSYFFTHILNRGITDQQGKTESFFWYLEVIKVSFRLWSLLLLPASILAIKKIFNKDTRYIFLTISTVIIFLFFSFSNSKLIWYIIPLYPLLSILAGDVLYKALLLVQQRAIFSKLKIEFKYIFTMVFPLLLILYFVNYNKLIYYPDFNKDLVSVIEAYNEELEVGSTNNPLYYLRIPTPAVRFYALNEPLASDIDPLKNKVEGAAFDKNFDYISRKGEVDFFKDEYGSDKIKVIKKSGAYYLTHIKSTEEYTNDKIVQTTSELKTAINAYSVAESPEDELVQIHRLQDRLFELENIRYQESPLKYNPPLLIYF